MSTQYLSLDWRNAPTASEIKDRILKLLTRLDAERQLPLRQGQTRAAHTVKLVEEIGNGKSPMVLRKDVYVVRKVSQAQHKYWARFVSMATYVVSLLMQKQQVKMRFLEYKQLKPDDGMTLAQARSILSDLAVTIGVHPLALGAVPEGTGKIKLPLSASMSCTMVTNVSSQQAEGNENVVKLAAGSTNTIEPCMKTLKVLKVKKRVIQAVVVVEHRNITPFLARHGNLVERAIFVLV